MAFSHFFLFLYRDWGTKTTTDKMITDTTNITIDKKPDTTHSIITSISTLDFTFGSFNINLASNDVMDASTLSTTTSTSDNVNDTLVTNKL